MEGTVKTKFTLAGAAVAATLLSVAPSYAASVLFSDDFESYGLGTTDFTDGGGTHWDQYSPENLSAVVVDATHWGTTTGNSTQFVQFQGSTKGAAVDSGIVTSDAIATGGATKISISFDYAAEHTESNDTLTLLTSTDGVVFTAIAGGALPLGTVGVSDGGTGGVWDSITFLQDVSAAFIKLEFNFVSHNPNEFSYLDNVVVSAVPLPDSLALLASGFAGLAFIGWKARRRSAGPAALA